MVWDTVFSTEPNVFCEEKADWSIVIIASIMQIHSKYKVKILWIKDLERAWENLSK